MKPVVCKKCKKVIKDKSGLPTHERYCSIQKKNVPFVCPICNQRIRASYKNHLKTCNGHGPRRCRLKTNGKRGGWNKGKTFEESYGKEKAKEMKKEISIRVSLNHNWKSFSDEKKNEIRNKNRKKILERYKAGWQPVCGRTSKIEYTSHVAGNIFLDGTWELRSAIFLDNLEVKWIRNKKRFEYYNTIRGTLSTYCPDFYVYDWNTYIEVKGYTTELDWIKWSQFPEEEHLEVWNEEILEELNILHE